MSVSEPWDKEHAEVRHLRELMELQFKSAEIALEVQAKAYDMAHRIRNCFTGNN